MKLSDYAKEKGISYVTAFRHWKKGYITGEQLASGTIIVHDRPQTDSYPTQFSMREYPVAKSNLEGQSP
jgi:putative resolvase